MGQLALDLAVARTAFRRFASYRAATLAGVITNTFFGVLFTSLVVTVTARRADISGYSRQDLVTQVWLMQGLLMTIAIWGWIELGDRVRSGDIAVDLYRPVDLQRWWLAHDTGRATYQALVRGTAPFLIASFLYDLRLPTRWWTAPLFVASVLVANTVSFALRFVVNLGAFWFHDVRGINRFSMAVTTSLSGGVLSLAFFPDRLERIARVLPFAQLFQTPVDIWLERRNGVALARLGALQLGWAVALLGLGRVVQRAATRVAVAQGG